MAKKKTNTAGIARREANAARNKQNNAKKAPVKISRAEQLAKEQKRAKMIKNFIIIFAAVALVAIVLTVIFAAIIPAIQAKRQQEREAEMLSFDSDMSQYLSLALNLAGGDKIDVTMLDKAPTDKDVRDEILSLLYSNAKTSEIDKTKYYTDKEIGAGDIANIFYRGYTIKADGSRNYFSGGSNLGSSYTALNIGKGEFVPGFELGLVGVIPANYVTVIDLSSISGTTVCADSIISITYNDIPYGSTAKQQITTIVDMSEDVDALFATGFRDYLLGAVCGEKITETVVGDDGKETKKSTFEYQLEEGKTSAYTDVTIDKVYARVNSTATTVGADSIVTVSYKIEGLEGKVFTLSTTVDMLNTKAIDDVWGEGFAASLVGKAIGETVVDSIEIGEEGSKQTRSDVKISKVSDRAGEGDSILTVDVTFPGSYGTASLQGRDAKFDLYILSTHDCEDIVFDEKFITETLKLTAEDLKDYEGSTLVEKYEAKVLKELTDSFEESRFTTVANKVFEILLEKSDVKKLPEGEVLKNYNAVLAEIQYYYSYYQSQGSSTYNTLDKVAIAYLGLDSDADWQAELRTQSEQAVTRQAAFYYLIKEMNYLPNDEEKKALREEIYNETFESYMESAVKDKDEYDSEKEYNEAKQSAEKSFAATYTDSYFDEQVRYKFAMNKIMEYHCNIHYGPVEE